MVVKWNMWKFVENLRDFSNLPGTMVLCVCTSVKQRKKSGQRGEKKSQEMEKREGNSKELKLVKNKTAQNV